MSLLKVPVADPTEQGAPSTQEVSLVADSTNANSLLRIAQIAGVRYDVNVEMSLVRTSAAAFGVSIALPPTGHFYIFIDAANSNKLTMIDSTGTTTVIGISGNMTITDLTVSGTTNLQGNTQLGLAGNLADRIIFFDDNGNCNLTFDPTGNVLDIGTKAGAAIDTRVRGKNLTLAALATDLIGFYGTTPAARGTVSLAAPVLLADCITQIEQLKAALGDVAGVGLVKLS